jgi:hypothetical protein
VRSLTGAAAQRAVRPVRSYVRPSEALARLPVRPRRLHGVGLPLAATEHRAADPIEGCSGLAGRAESAHAERRAVILGVLEGMRLLPSQSVYARSRIRTLEKALQLLEVLRAPALHLSFCPCAHPCVCPSVRLSACPSVCASHLFLSVWLHISPRGLFCLGCA